VGLQPTVGPWSLFNSLILYTVGRTPRTGDKPDEKPLLTHRITTAEYTHRHPHLEWVSNPRSRCFSGRRQFVHYTDGPLRSVELQILTHCYRH
jgi:hypothetical protein